MNKREQGLGIAALIGLVAGGRAEAAPQVVSQADLRGWEVLRLSADPLVGAAAHISFGLGPMGAPLGRGSVRLATGPDVNELVLLHHGGFAGKRLADLRALSYQSYITDNGTCNAPYLTLWVDTTKDGVPDDGLVFEPCYQTADYGVPAQGMVVRDRWQVWDVHKGGFWLRTGGPPIFTLAQYLAQHPEARLGNFSSGRGGLRILAGGGVRIAAHVDAVTVSFGEEQVYDFDPAVAAAPDLGVGADLASGADLGAAGADLGQQGEPGGCQVAGGAAGGAAWPLPLLLLLAARLRRRRIIRQ